MSGNAERLLREIRELLDGPEKLERMETAIRRIAHPEATRSIVAELERLGSSRGAALA